MKKEERKVRMRKTKHGSRRRREEVFVIKVFASKTKSLFA